MAKKKISKKVIRKKIVKKKTITKSIATHTDAISPQARLRKAGVMLEQSTKTTNIRKPTKHEPGSVNRAISVPADPSRKKTLPTARPRVSIKKYKAPILLLAGEHSGDLLGAEIVQALHREGFQKFLGTGGDEMQNAGVEIIKHVREMTVIGLVEGLKAYRRLKKFALSLANHAVERGVKTAILIDYPGFNLRFAAMLRERGIHIIYVVSPQFWAWKYKRIYKIKELVELMLPLFPFEADLFKKIGMHADCIGHPLVYRIPRQLKLEKVLPSPPGGIKYTIALIPGSRRGEVRRLLPEMLAAARILQKEIKNIRYLLPVADENLQSIIDEALVGYEDLSIEVCHGQTYRIMEASDLLLIASGTATLEGAFFKKPMVLLYKISWLNLVLITMLMRVRFVGIVNLLGRRQVHIELLQSEVQAKNIVAESLRILKDKDYKETMLVELDYVRRQLGRGNPAKLAAEHISDFIATHD